MKPYNSFVRLVAGLVLAFTTSLAAAGAILDLDSRSITGSVFTQQEFGQPPVSDSFSHSPGSPFADFTQSDSVSLPGENASASASSAQTSSLTPILFTAVGNAAASALSGETSQAQADSDSSLTVDFSLTTTHLASLTGNLFRSVEPGDGSLTTGSSVALVDLVAPTLLYSESAPGGSTLPFTQDLVLGPGSYRLRVGSNVDTFFLPEIDLSGTASYDMRFTLTNVPEPTTLALLSFGLAGIGIARHKKMT